MRVIYRNIIVGGVCGLSLWGLLVQGEAHRPSAREERQAWAKEVFEEYCPELRKNPDVFACIPDGDDIRIVTDRPTAVPAKLDEVRILTQPPPPHLPPPLGVIVLKPDGTRLHRPELSECPAGHREYKKYRWRFCNPISKPQVIPADIMTPPIAGTPYEEAKEIIKRQTLIELPGVRSVGLTANGIVVETDRPELVPAYVESLPVEIEEPEGELIYLNHTQDTVQPFLQGATIVAEEVWLFPEPLTLRTGQSITVV